MPFINYNEASLSPYIKEFEEIGTHLGIEISDDEVWEQAREYEEIPVFENIYQNLLLSRICSHFADEDYIEKNGVINLKGFINGMDTHLYYQEDNEAWTCLRSLEEFLEYENKKLLEKAKNSVTLEIINRIEHGEEIELNSKYHLYKYTEEDIISVYNTEDNEELEQVLIDREEILFEKL